MKKYLLSLTCKIVYLALIFFATFEPTLGQQSENRSPDKGFLPARSYALSDIENINTTNGNVVVSVPVASLPPGRNGLSHGINLYYNSKLYESFVGDATNTSNQTISANLLRDDQNGGWRYGYKYDLHIVNRNNVEGTTPCTPIIYDNNGEIPNYGDRNRPDYNCVYVWKVLIVYPDGSEHEFRPTGYTDYFIPGNGTGPQGGYFNVSPFGQVQNVAFIHHPPIYTIPFGHWTYQITYSQDSRPAMVYYSTDGSKSRLIYQRNGDWELSFSDGKRISNVGGIQKINDRNGNYVEINGNTVTDQFGRQIRIQHINSTQDLIHSVGVNGESLVTTVKWKDVSVQKPYTAPEVAGGRYRGTISEQTYETTLRSVDEVVLPSQVGNLKYTFGYNAEVSPAIGWGELSSITLPSGAKADYQFVRDNFQSPNPMLSTTQRILRNAIKQKTLTYQSEYDGISTPVTEVWKYDIATDSSTVTQPDGTVIYQRFGDTAYEHPQTGLVLQSEVRETTSTGFNGVSRTEYIYAKNVIPLNFGSESPSVRLDFYVKTEFTTLFDAAGTPSLTAIKDFAYDQNGNIKQITEYDWVAYGSVTRDGANGLPIAIPSGAVIKRKTVNTLAYQTPDASSGSNTANTYWNDTAPLLRNAIISSEIQNASGEVVSRTEFTYDNSATTGNITETRIWDSWKSGNYQPIISGTLLTSSNSISTTALYDAYGNVIETTDAKGVKTKFIYGAITSPTGTVSNLYTTETIAAFGTPLQRSSTAEYDFHTGLVKKEIVLGNNPSENAVSETVYDALGRETLEKEAVGTPQEVWERTEYDDTARRVITRSDLFNKGDGLSVAIAHNDQLGRVRLTRTLEDAATQDPYNEQQGIKVQTRYKFDNPTDPLNSNGSYALVSNPYRAATSAQAASEQGMGWKLTFSDKSGRMRSMKAFSGADPPAPFGSNTSSLGVVLTDYDANAVIVTDEAGKKRRSLTNSLGQMVRVDEPDVNNNLGTIDAPVQPTAYIYDTLSNLTQITQGEQNRYFTYDSRSRLKTANNPESGTFSYKYDDNSNVIEKKDARNVTTTIGYDLLNRPTGKIYSDGTPMITYTYDEAAVPFSKGKLTRVSNSSSTTEYTAFDAQGRTLSHRQITGGNIYSTAYKYDVGGNLIEQTYPSGRVVKNVFDNGDDLVAVSSRTAANRPFRNYAGNFSYTAHGTVSSMRLGNGRWESLQINAKRQPLQIGLGAAQNGTDIFKLEYNYDTTQNNGNVQSQTITVPTVGATVGFTALQTYTYDSLNRLKVARETVGGAEKWKQTFLYDRYGNRTFDAVNTTTLNKTCAGNPDNVCQPAVNNPNINSANNRFTTAQGYTFDVSGNLTHDAENRKFVFNADNKQTEVRNATTDALQAQYFYDGDGNRVKKKVIGTGEETIFVYDANNKLVAEYSINVPAPTTPTTQYLTGDHLGTPRVITNASGDVISRRDHLPFGEEILAGTSTATSNRSNHPQYATDNIRQKFTGKIRDEETGLDYFEARYYSSKWGRFTTSDEFVGGPEELIEFDGMQGHNPTFYAELAEPQSLNKYHYCLNNPLRYVDPNGHQTLPADVLRGRGFPIIFPSAEELKKAGNAAAQIQADITRAINNGIIDAKEFIEKNAGQLGGGAGCLAGQRCLPSYMLNKDAGQGNSNGGTNNSASETVTEVKIDAQQYPEAASHIRDAQKKGKPSVLTVDRKGSSKRRRQSLRGVKTEEGKDRDEYPPAVTREGGKGASVRPIGSSDNRGAGSSMGGQIRNVPNGGKIRIKVVNTRKKNKTE